MARQTFVMIIRYGDTRIGVHMKYLFKQECTFWRDSSFDRYCFMDFNSIRVCWMIDDTAYVRKQSGLTGKGNCYCRDIVNIRLSDCFVIRTLTSFRKMSQLPFAQLKSLSFNWKALRPIKNPKAVETLIQELSISCLWLFPIAYIPKLCRYFQHKCKFSRCWRQFRYDYILQKMQKYLHWADSHVPNTCGWKVLK